MGLPSPAKRSLALLMMMMLSSVAGAATAICTGKLTHIANHANGINGLYIVVGNNNIIRACSFTAAQFSVTPEDCRHMASIAALAFATQDDVTFYVDNAPTTECSDVPAWFVANTRYLAVTKS